MLDESSSGRPTGLKQISPTHTISELELHRFGGLAGLRKPGFHKVVRLVDPFSDGAMAMLHFPSTLHADNWLISCFTRSLACTVPVAPLQALDRGRLLTSPCSLILLTPKGMVADFVVRTLDDTARKAWARFQVVAGAHGLAPQLRTREDIRATPMYVQNLDRMRQQLVQGYCDPARAATRILIKRLVGDGGSLVLAQLARIASTRSLSRLAVECAVIELYRNHEIEMNVMEAAYGDDTRIQLL